VSSTQPESPFTGSTWGRISCRPETKPVLQAIEEELKWKLDQAKVASHNPRTGREEFLTDNNQAPAKTRHKIPISFNSL